VGTIDGILGPCGQISFLYIAPHVATVLMTFEGIAGGPPRGLTLKFTHVVVLCGEEECPGGFALIPKPLPQLGRGDHPTWTFPLLKLREALVAGVEAGVEAERTEFFQRRHEFKLPMSLHVAVERASRFRHA
jgi:hypothetical protein